MVWFRWSCGVSVVWVKVWVWWMWVCEWRCVWGWRCGWRWWRGLWRVWVWVRVWVGEIVGVGEGVCVAVGLWRVSICVCVVVAVLLNTLWLTIIDFSNGFWEFIPYQRSIQSPYSFLFVYIKCCFGHFVKTGPNRAWESRFTSAPFTGNLNIQMLFTLGYVTLNLFELDFRWLNIFQSETGNC